MANAGQLDPELVRDFVASAHGDVARVHDLLRQEPRLANAAWDWGGGDWETALGAAAHMGRKDIAQLLIGKGARVDIFAAAMLGWTDIVRAMLAAVPEARTWQGPHGISLLQHAEAGGADAALVMEYLRGLEEPR